MNKLPAKGREAQTKRLNAAIGHVLGSAMGVRWKPLLGVRTLKPVPSALFWLATYSLAWAGVSYLTAQLELPSQPKLVSLLGWGGCYFAAAIFFAQSATLRIAATVECDIVPHASAEFLESVAKDLERTYGPPLLTVVPLLVGTASLAAAFWAIGRDNNPYQMPFYSPELLFWAATYFLYLVTAARSVVAARFYLSFARCLERESDSFYVLAAAESPLVKGLAKLGGQVLAFWATIFISILSIMLLVLVPEPYRFAGSSWVLSILIPVAGFFSFGFGTIVYLDSEARIRAILRRFTQKHAAILQERANAILNPLAGRVPHDDAELRRLTDWHDRILAGGHYGSRLRTGLSILLPFIPLVSLIQTIYGLLPG